MQNVKPGYKTSEFWVTCVVFLLCAAVQSGLMGTGSQLENVVALIGEVFGGLGYGGFRSTVKKQFERRLEATQVAETVFEEDDEDEDEQ